MVCKQTQLRLCIVTVLLGVWTEVTRGEPRIQLSPPYPEIGGSVTLTVTGITGSILYIHWYKRPASSDDYRILSYFPVSPPLLIPGTLFHNGMEVPSSGSLRISNLHRADEGQYRVRMQTDREEEASVHLRVYEAVGKPAITSSSSQPKENDRVTLTCTSSNAERITWSRVSGSISSGVTFSSDKKTLTWPRITRTDTGAYQCKGENPISSKLSDPYTLTVSYGPEKVMVKFGSNKYILQCSAESVPPADYSWIFNGIHLNINQQTLLLDETGPVQGGIYECEAYNAVTKKTASNNVTVTAVVFPQDENDNKTGMIIGSVMAVVLLLLIGVLVYIFLIRRWQKQSNSTTEAKQPSNCDTPIRPVYENMTALEGNMPKRSKQAMEMDNAVGTGESHYEQLGPQDKAVYSTLIPGQEI